MPNTHLLNRLTTERRTLLAAAREAADRVHTNAMQVLLAHAANAGVTDLILLVDEDTAEESLRLCHVTIDGTSYTRHTLPEHARPLIEAASELPAFTQHSFTDYLIDLEEEQGSLDYVPMRVDLARAFADHGITA